MLLAIDVGNTNITCGIYEKSKLVTTFRITTKIPRTSDEYGMILNDLLGMNGIKNEQIKGSCVASVVPNVMHELNGAIRRYFNLKPLVVGPGTKTGIKIVTDNPREIGPDRIVDLVGAYEKYGGPILVIDFGTATTYDLLTEDGSFGIGITAPGMGISARVLWQDTARLPEIEIKKPDSILARETITSMQAGLVYGQIGQTEYIIEQVKKEAGIPDLKVVATGGLGQIIAEETEAIQIYDKMLTLDGLRFIYERNKR